MTQQSTKIDTKHTDTSRKPVSEMGFWQIIRRFFEPAMANKIVAFWLIATVVQWGLFGVFNVYMIKVLVRDIELLDSGSLFYHILLYIGIIVVYQILNFLIVRKGYLHHAVSKTLNHLYVKRFVTIDNTYCEKYGTGKLISIIEGGISVRSDLMQRFFVTFPEFLVAFVYAIYVIANISLWYFLVFVLILFAVWYSTLYLNKRGHVFRKQRYEFQTIYKRNFIKILMSKFEILQSNKISGEVEGLNKNIDEQWAIDHKKHVYEHLAFNIPDQTILLFKIAVYFFVGMLVITGKESLENLLLYVGLLAYVDHTVKEFWGGVVQTVVKKYVAIQKLRDLFDEAPMIEGYDVGTEFEFTNGDVSLNSIGFAYGEAQVFSDFSLDIPGGSKTALVGPSGSGKTTLVKLIAGYLRPDHGGIHVDGQRLPGGNSEKSDTHISLQSYYQHIGYLTQEPSVFDGTVLENLTYAVDSDIDQEVINTAIKNAKCEFIYDFPNGLDTEIGERGIRLSGGQRQRLAIAKIFLKDPHIIILDEPTSALDSESEEAVTQAMNTLFEGRTVIIIAHRLQTVKHADRILYLEHGQVVEEGTHQELMEIAGKYHKMVELQSGF